MDAKNLTNVALVLGASGGIGGETARALARAGWSVRALQRDPGKAAAAWTGPALEWVQGDAMDEASVVRAAAGCSLIVHAVNPPGYQNWATLVLPMMRHTIAAAKASGARIVIAGSVYNYGPDAFPDLREDSPEHPVTRKGAIRVQVEDELREAAKGGVRVLVVRAGDFFGPGAGGGNSWFSQIVKPGKEVSSITVPGSRGVGHQWQYLPDMAEAIVRLVARPDLEPFARFHLGGHWDADGTEIAASIRRVTGKPQLKTSAFPWWATTLAAPFVALFRELREMRYLWQTPVRLRNERIVAFLGEEPHTPLDEAVRETLRGFGSLPRPIRASGEPARSHQG